LTKNINYDYDISKKLIAKRNFSKKQTKKSKGPNKTELKLLKILGSNFKYVGNGSKIIFGKNPDFINEKDRIIVELYGDYWHRNETIRKTINRIELFRSAGYKTIVIWEHEINPITVMRKILKAYE
jgi:very-short-patch-repair endonuclease